MTITSRILPQPRRQVVAEVPEHGAPDLPFYEEVGSASYRFASDHHLARRNALDDVYRTIANNFSEVRRDLNRLSDQLLCVEPPWSVQS